MTACLLALAGAAGAQETGWSDTAELSYVVTAGNAQSATLGFSNKMVRRWPSAEFEMRFSGIRAESTTQTRVVTAAGPPVEVSTWSDTRLSAENYGMSTRYSRTLSEHMFWYGGVSWKRNRFAGFDNRYIAAGGLGTTWFEEPGHRFRTEYAATFTRQEDLLSSEPSTFAGARLSWEYARRLTDTADFENVLELDANLQETEDFRADMDSSVQVRVSQKLALKVGLKWIFDNRPSFVAVDDPEGLLPPGETARVQLEKLDTLFTTSLVLNF
ncbi:MAG: DUF481 domain-containing protein [bacterium]